MTCTDFPTDFWVAVAAAAPVLALAGLVAFTDAGVAGDVLKRTRKDWIDEGKTTKEEFRKQLGWGRLFGAQNRWVVVYGVLNLVVQGFVLIVALWALLYEDPPIPGIWIVGLEVFGLVVLLVSAFLAAQVGWQRQRVENKQKEYDAQKLAKEIAKALGHQQPGP
jgi:heme A synthase